MATYAGIVGTVVLYGVANALAEGMETQAWAAMLDPFGVRAAMVATRYWTIFEKNTQVIPLEGVFLWNRVVWVGVTLACLAFAYAASLLVNKTGVPIRDVLVNWSWRKLTSFDPFHELIDAHPDDNARSL